MNRPSVNVAILLFATIISNSIVTSATFSKEDLPDLPQSIVYLGTVEGKSFFAEMTPKRTWLEARAFCLESNMILASITSVSQATLLQNSRNSDVFLGNFWIGGRDAQHFNQFVWDSNREAVSDRYLTLHVLVDIQTCLAYYTDGPEYQSTLCTSLFGTLCEIG